MLVGTRKSHVNVFEKLDKLKAYGVDVRYTDTCFVNLFDWF